MNDAATFTANRKHSVTDNRIRAILWYIAECYTYQVKDKVQYSRSQVRCDTTIHFEDFLRFRLVEDYLIKNKSLLKRKMSDLEEVCFTSETQKEYIDVNDGKQKPDKIDISISRLGLNDIWGCSSEQIYFAIECKRLKGVLDVTQYVTDISKFTNRDYIGLRLPFEGQLAFIEFNINHGEVAGIINQKLRLSQNILTNMFLSHCDLHENINGTYISKHKRNISTEGIFSIYHILLDYSKIVVD